MSTGGQSWSGLLIRYLNAPVIAGSCLQKSVARSSTGAQYFAHSDAGLNMLRLRIEMVISQNRTSSHQDSTGTIEFVKEAAVEH